MSDEKYPPDVYAMSRVTSVATTVVNGPTKTPL
jgi:hypothetical protein